MRVVLQVWSSNPDYSGGCDYAAVETSEEPEDQMVAVECAQMIVRNAGIAFAALLRHTDIYLTTAEIPRAIIESALAAAA